MTNNFIILLMSLKYYIKNIPAKTRAKAKFFDWRRGEYAASNSTRRRQTKFQYIEIAWYIRYIHIHMQVYWANTHSISPRYTVALITSPGNIKYVLCTSSTNFNMSVAVYDCTGTSLTVIYRYRR
jgi:hypothetical protein